MKGSEGMYKFLWIISFIACISFISGCDESDNKQEILTENKELKSLILTLESDIVNMSTEVALSSLKDELLSVRESAILITDITIAASEVSIQLENGDILTSNSSLIDSFNLDIENWAVEITFSDLSSMNLDYLGLFETIKIVQEIDPYIKTDLAVSLNIVSPVKQKIVLSYDNEDGENIIVETSSNNIHNILVQGLKEEFTNIVNIDIYSPIGLKRFSITENIITGELPRSTAPLIEIVYDIASSDYSWGRPVVFAGDSMIHVMNWNYLFRKVFGGAEFPIILNRGIGGNVTATFLKRFKSNVLDLNPSSIFIEIGTNDLIRVNPDNSSVVEESLVSNYKEILALALNSSEDAKIYIMSILPVLDNDYRNTVAQRVNEKLRLMALDDERLMYIDCFTPFYDFDTNQTRSEFMIGPSTAHINDLGYENWAQTIYPFIRF